MPFFFFFFRIIGLIVKIISESTFLQRHRDKKAKSFSWAKTKGMWNEMLRDDGRKSRSITLYVLTKLYWYCKGNKIGNITHQGYLREEYLQVEMVALGSPHSASFKFCLLQLNNLCWTWSGKKSGVYAVIEKYSWHLNKVPVHLYMDFI